MEDWRMNRRCTQVNRDELSKGLGEMIAYRAIKQHRSAVRRALAEMILHKPLGAIADFLIPKNRRWAQAKGEINVSPHLTQTSRLEPEPWRTPQGRLTPAERRARLEMLKGAQRHVLDRWLNLGYGDDELIDATAHLPPGQFVKDVIEAGPPSS
jgi:hypothetical protein